MTAAIACTTSRAVTLVRVRVRSFASVREDAATLVVRSIIFSSVSFSRHLFHTMFSSLLQLVNRLVHRQIFHFENIEETIRLCPIVAIIPQNPLRGGNFLGWWLGKRP